MKKDCCIACGKSDLSKNEIGINKKLIGDEVKIFYCLNCLAEYLGVSTEDIYDKIEEFKERGCNLFD
jgi:hypothetical protein